MGILLYVICCFSLVSFSIFSLYLMFANSINIYLGMFLLGFILYWTLCFLDLGDSFLPHVREIFKYEVKWSESHSVPWGHSVTPWIYSPWNSPGQNTRGGSLSPLQGIFPTQGSNPDLPHCRQILYQLSHKESPWILEWVAYPFSSKSSQPRNRTRVSCIVGGFFPNWAIRWALFNYNPFKYFFQALYLLEYL